MGRKKIDSKYIDVNLTRTIIISAFLAIYCIYLSVDNFIKGSNMIGFLALFCSVMTAITMVLLSVCKFGKKPRKILMHSAIIIMCFVYWFTFGVFLYTGGTGLGEKLAHRMAGRHGKKQPQEGKDEPGKHPLDNPVGLPGPPFDLVDRNIAAGLAERPDGDNQ